jgi:hypothetical protein
MFLLQGTIHHWVFEVMNWVVTTFWVSESVRHKHLPDFYLFIGVGHFRAVSVTWSRTPTLLYGPFWA